MYRIGERFCLILMNFLVGCTADCIGLASDNDDVDVLAFAEASRAEGEAEDNEGG